MSQNTILACLKASAIAVFLLFLQPATAQTKKKNDKEYGTEAYPELDAMLSRHQKQLGNDVVVMLWRDTVVYKKELGDFTAKTEAPLASASKWLTTALIMMLVDEGKLSLDDKVSDYLPIFSTYGKNYITIGHCLTHYTGIQAGQKLFDDKIGSLEEEAASYAKKEIQTNPGTEFRYSNAGFFIVGRIAEVVTKKKFDQLIKSKLFNPLGMSKTTFGTLDGSGINPSDGARTNANDYLRFLTMLLNNGEFNGKQLLSADAVKQMRKISASTAQIKFAPKAVAQLNYALGSWSLEEDGSEATALASPGLFGAFPVVDWCRGYALVILPKNILAEQKSDAYLRLKSAVDEKIRSRCK